MTGAARIDANLLRTVAVFEQCIAKCLAAKRLTLKMKNNFYFEVVIYDIKIKISTSDFAALR